MTSRDWYCEDILSGKVPVMRIWEDDLALAFAHPHPSAEIHIVVIPKTHVSSLLDPLAADGRLLSSMVTAIQHSARQLGLEATGFCVRANVAEQNVTPHMHWHVRGPGIEA